MSYIDPAGKVFAHLDRLVGWRRGEKHAPVTIEWDLSNACTLGCEFGDGGICHFAYTHTKGPWTIMPRQFPYNRDKGQSTLADPDLVSKVLCDVAVAGVQGIVWTGGGEPTTHPQWTTIVEKTAQVGLEQGMYTHGGLFKPDTAKFLAERATWVVVSLDHVDGEGYARYKHVPTSRFDAACNGVRWLTGSKAVIGVSYLLHAQNWNRARDMVQLSRDLGATYTTLRPAIHTQPDAPNKILGDRSWVTDALPLIGELAQESDVETDPARFVQYRDWTKHPYQTCCGIQLNTTITPDGRVWVCPNRREYANSCVGDLKTESFSTIWARHPGRWTDFKECRAMCRLHVVNQTIDQLAQPRPHGAFI